MALKPLFSMKVEGLRELNDALEELPKATQKNVLKRVAVIALEPFIEMARAIVRIGKTGRLHDSLTIATRLSKRQAKLARANKKSYVEVYAGASALPHAHLLEFGTRHSKAFPFMRPAWDSKHRVALELVRQNLGKEIDAAAKRMARKAARTIRKVRAKVK